MYAAPAAAQVPADSVASLLSVQSLKDLMCSILQEMSSSVFQGIQMPIQPLQTIAVPVLSTLPASDLQVPHCLPTPFQHPLASLELRRSPVLVSSPPGPPVSYDLPSSQHLRPPLGMSPPPTAANARAASVVLASSHPTSPASDTSSASSRSSHASQHEFLYIHEVQDQVICTHRWVPLPFSLWRVGCDEEDQSFSPSIRRQ